jgi:hypothetical protein
MPAAVLTALINVAHPSWWLVVIMLLGLRRVRPVRSATATSRRSRSKLSTTKVSPARR